MIPDEIREAIRVLKQQGRGLREISRALGVSRNTVRRVLRQESPKPSREAPGQQAIVSVLPEIYRRCKGNGVRIREVLKDEHDIDIAYSTLTHLLRGQELREPKRRSGIYTFEPGEEMQHDTSPHRLELGGKQVCAQCASLVLAYSRMLFILYYPAFTRFEAKAFLTEALRFFDGVCPRCIVDNTHVVVASGSGPDAIIAPEMVAFGELFGMVFIPHAIGHSDRKGRVERPFAYVENNFLAGRTFQDWADLNAQAHTWCENTANATLKRKLGMTPQAAHVMEKPLLLSLPLHIPAVTQIHYRVVDTQGYVHLDTNRYSVPERLLGKEVAVHKRIEQVLVFHDGQRVAEHPRLTDKRNTDHLIKGHHPRLQRGRTPSGPSPQEQALTGRNPLLDQYVAALKKRSPGRGVARLRRLLELQRTYPAGPFLAAVEQALQYGMFDLTRLERLILERVAGDFFDLGEED
jgi:transposase